MCFLWHNIHVYGNIVVQWQERIRCDSIVRLGEVRCSKHHACCNPVVEHCAMFVEFKLVMQHHIDNVQNWIVYARNVLSLSAIPPFTLSTYMRTPSMLERRPIVRCSFKHHEVYLLGMSISLLRQTCNVFWGCIYSERSLFLFIRRK